MAVNARDAMPNGGKLSIETANVDLDSSYAQSRAEVTPGRYVRLAISDTGCGMTDDVKARIFEPFFTTKGLGKGTGLGLATVYAIIKQSGGHIYVYSEPGHGTTFKLYLPCVEEHALPNKLSMSLPTSPNGDETILLVEDEDAVRALTRHALQSFGYTVLEASGGADVIEIFQHCALTIDIVVSDVVIPKISGRELIERLRQIRPDIRVLYFSGYTDDVVIRQGVLEAGVAFLQKPFTPKALAAKIREVLDGTGRR
jgi:CheY-like chemotaxis protein